MIPLALEGFISRLTEWTERGKIRWFQGDSDSYFCDHKELTLHISLYFDADRMYSTIFFRLVKGEKVTPFSVAEHENEYSAMKALYEAVVANANDVGNDIAGFFDE
ncbi:MULTISPECIES: hypothetical protein [Burkholderia]|uniref:hypothetical protein n=1 Tax=Burkholderia TaxID=32008 RepID=UPI0006A5954C|nr:MULTISPECIES: hypothetical protein [Burkholderia]KVF03987.1 hypothetical protein WJ04_21260 [Burkholderia vietnamiensis]CAG9203851.1 conserved hypothetical protein [Burkholderia vietnamiensis]CAJ3570097.1 Uncharacterised protein [Burkholderia pseudomallei]